MKWLRDLIADIRTDWKDFVQMLVISVIVFFIGYAAGRLW